MDTRGSILVRYINFILVGYGLRDMYKPGMSELEVLLYQMDQLISEHSSELANHFNAQGFATSTFASRWFLTLFSAVFPKVCSMSSHVGEVLKDSLKAISRESFEIIPMCIIWVFKDFRYYLNTIF